MNRRQILMTASAATLSTTWFNLAFAQERGSKDEAKALVEAAVAHAKKVGADQAFKDFQNDKATWFKKDLYIFAYDMKGVCQAFGSNDKMVGKDLIELKDPNGKFIMKEFIALVSSKGSGWVEYEFTNPVTKKMGSKASYLQKLPNFDGFLGVGAYL